MKKVNRSEGIGGNGHNSGESRGKQPLMTPTCNLTLNRGKKPTPKYLEQDIPLKEP